MHKRMIKNIPSSNITKNIDGDKYDNVFIVGDIHGWHTNLMVKLDKIGFNKDTDLLLCTGDLIDRGPESEECIELLYEPWFESVRGNHEDLFIGSQWDKDLDNIPAHQLAHVTGYRNCHLQNGGRWVVWDELKSGQIKELTRLLDVLPYFITIERKGVTYGVTHACVPGSDIKASHFSESDLDRVMWDRTLCDIMVSGYENHVKGVDKLFYGHTPMGIKTSGNTILIDTGWWIDGDIKKIGLVNIEDY